MDRRGARGLSRQPIRQAHLLGQRPGALQVKLTWQGSDSISDERIPMMMAPSPAPPWRLFEPQAAVSPGGETPSGLVEAIELEPDFYALSLSPQAPKALGPRVLRGALPGRLRSPHRLGHHAAGGALVPGLPKREHVRGGQVEAAHLALLESQRHEALGPLKVK